MMAASPSLPALAKSYETAHEVVDHGTPVYFSMTGAAAVSATASCASRWFSCSPSPGVLAVAHRLAG